jgi:hypothetical protein
MDTPHDAVVFRPARSLPVLNGIIGLVCLAFVWFCFEAKPEGVPPAWVAAVGVPMGLLCLWGIVYWPSLSTVVHPSGIIRRGPLRVRHLAWADVGSWQTDVDTDNGRRTVTLRLRSKLFGVSFDDWRVARPGFDDFLELVRQYAGDKESPQPTKTG